MLFRSLEKIVYWLKKAEGVAETPEQKAVIAKLKLKPKEEIKMDIGCSPDWRDMFLMRAWFDYNEYDIPDDIERRLGITA